MKINQKIMEQALHWGYDKALKDSGVLDSAFDLANDYLQKHPYPHEAVNRLINSQTAQCAMTGFVTGCGGLLTIPVTLPVNIASVLFMQLRMIAAIAILSDYDPKSDPVRSIAFACLMGSAASDILKGVGIKIGEKITQKAIERMSGQVLTKINELVGFRLFTKFSSNGIVNFGKVIPLAGGVVCGTIDGASTRIIGKTAMKVFLPPSHS